MIKIEFKEPVKGMLSTYCKGISVDPMDETVFIIQYRSNAVWTTPITNIKHISSYNK